MALAVLYLPELQVLQLRFSSTPVSVYWPAIHSRGKYVALHVVVFTLPPWSAPTPEFLRMSIAYKCTV